MKIPFRFCMACGLEGDERSVRLIVVEVPLEERVDVTVSHPVTFREGAVEATRVVPGRYAAELRCRDVGACQLRAAGLTDEQRGLPPRADVVVTTAEVDEALAAWVPEGLAAWTP